jgi:hypothetical protein
MEVGARCGSVIGSRGAATVSGSATAGATVEIVAEPDWSSGERD